MQCILEEIEGIGPVYGEKLRAIGITTVDKLLERCAGKQGRVAVARETGIDEKSILTWTNHADLFRIQGIGPQFSELLEEAGVDTVKLYVDIVHKYKADSFDIKHDTEAFALELAAMYVRELFPIPQIREANPDLNFGTALMPRYKEWGTVFNTESAFVYKMTENYDLAWDLIEFFNQEKYLKEWFRNSGWVPPRIDIDFTDIFAEEPAYKTALEFPEGYIFATYPPLPCVDEIYTKLGERLEKAFRDSSLVDNPEGIKLVLEGAAEETNEILRENGLYGEGEIEPYWVISK